MHSSNIRSRTRNLQDIVFPALIGCLCMAARMINATRFWMNNTLLPQSPDPYFHLRLIDRFMNGDWSLPLFEPLLNHPHGALLYWPPGFDMALALIARPFHSLTASFNTGAFVLGLTIPLLGTLAVLFLWFSVRRLGLPPVQSALLLILSLSSYSLVEATRFGRVDHQALELLGWCVALWLFIRIQAGEPRHQTRDSRILGTILGISLFFWNGALVVIGLVNISFLLATLAQANPDDSLRRWKTVTLFTLPGALLSILLTGTFPAHPFSSVYLSFFHLTACTAAFVLVFVWQMLNRTRGPRRARQLVLYIILAGLILMVAIQGNALTDVLLRRDLNAAFVPESTGMFSAYRYSILFQPLILMVPFLIIGLVIRFQQEDLRPLTASLLGLLALTLVLSILQIRFLPLMEPVSILGCAFLLRRYMDRKPHAGRWISIAMFVFVLVPSTYLLAIRKAEAKSFPVIKAILPVMTWLHDNSTDNEAVLSPVWGYGHYVVCLAQRPTVSSAFGGTPAFERGIQASLLSAFVPGEQQLLRIMDDTDSRILLLPDMTNLRDDYRLAWKRSGMSPLPVHAHYELDRLYNWNNDHTDKPGDASPTFNHLRLLYNGPHQVNGKTAFRIYERVRGAQITGKVDDPDMDYFATIVLLPSNGKPVLWQSPIEPDSDGEFRIICPYNTEQNGDLNAISALEIWDAGSRNVIQRYAIQEDDVQNGNVIDQPKPDDAMDR